MYTRTERWAAHCSKTFDFEEELADGTLFEEELADGTLFEEELADGTLFEEELADGTLFEEGETRWILEESPERTTKAVLSSLGDDGLKRRHS
ncbi:hypothetical protein AVEN_247931-1 [Araneus ventricosus]|uniref:Uncharacterized protein n=1 Tax=Araneus ventricosus TaxID=182803 RepID=A0A4Y2CJX2_ARAVE|nr:hypothetical protein AVEN_247931-1 [Araneus ventricosus]